MGQRLELHNLLLAALQGPHVYFQPPASVKMQYPCIVYQRVTESVDYADNLKYRNMKLYQVTVIDRDPDSLIPDRVSGLPFCSHERTFAAEDLNHDVFSLHY